MDTNTQLHNQPPQNTSPQAPPATSTRPPAVTHAPKLERRRAIGGSATPARAANRFKPFWTGVRPYKKRHPEPIHCGEQNADLGRVNARGRARTEAGGQVECLDAAEVAQGARHRRLPRGVGRRHYRPMEMLLGTTTNILGI